MKLKHKVNIMEVCGTHTMSIARHGLKSILSKRANLLSGPGCPVCVTPVGDIDTAIELSKIPNVIITTFGDMLKVPGSYSSLEKEHANGADIRMVYSSADALELAVANPGREIVFLGIGFETTAPAIAATIAAAKKAKVANFSVLAMFKMVVPALKFILNIKGHKIDAFILPGNVSAIIGSNAYKFIPREYHLPGVIAGFAPSEILQAVEMLFRQIASANPKIEVEYGIVSPVGNPTAKQLMKEVFCVKDSNWRAIGKIPKSGRGINKAYSAWDASKKFKISVLPPKESKSCLCGKILLGLKLPSNCRLFARACTPEHPVGPCMVSSEGSCAAHYKYGKVGQANG
jgi:hydrogenase expression/formation protein HypD